MNTYKFEITETLQKIVSIEAFDETEAYKIISNKYRKQEIILDSDDFVEREINILD